MGCVYVWFEGFFSFKNSNICLGVLYVISLLVILKCAPTFHVINFCMFQWIWWTMIAISSYVDDGGLEDGCLMWLFSINI